MQLMNVRLVDKVLYSNCVYLAVNEVLCGIFEMEYTADKNVRGALQRLLASNRHPVFAIRDFNLTPTMLAHQFDTPTDGFDFPSFPERYAVSSVEPTENSKPAAILSKPGLDAYAELSDHGMRLYELVRLCTSLSVASAVLGMLLMFLFFCLGSYGVANVTSAIIYMLVFLLTETVLSFTFRAD